MIMSHPELMNLNKCTLSLTDTFSGLTNGVLNAPVMQTAGVEQRPVSAERRGVVN
jgi:hypothetical protein